MKQSLNVVVLVGSLRAASLSRKVARALMQRAPASLACEIVEIGNLPLYNEDLEQSATPAAWTEFRARMRKADAVLFVTPEYNRSIPGGLKNALDVGSRPAKASVFDGLPAGVVSVTPYRLGAFGANHALRQTFVFLNMPVMQQPEAYLGQAADAFGPDDSVQDAEVSRLLEKFMRAFEVWIRAVKTTKPHDFAAFMQERRAVAAAYVHGDAAPLSAIVSRRDPATFLPPGGEPVAGADNVTARYAKDAQRFQGGTTELEVLHCDDSGDLAFWTGLQHASVQVGNGEPTTMTLRVTEIFRFEDGDFKLVHRHADGAGRS
jgi:NAD(P)H-dependent FMN reductase/ketosteroid isomerase-like protein